ncbi:MAG: L,D-transpeptidase [Salinarimonas sp.]
MQRLTMILVLAAWFAFAPASLQARERVAFDLDVPAGTIVVRASERALYLDLGDGTAIRYRVAVPRSDKMWTGWRRIDGKHVAPAWIPPPDVRRDLPHLPDLIPGGHPSNPMGAAALTLDDGLTAIHGTTRTMRASIGSAASYGCIRMRDEDVLDLMQRVRVGTAVVMVR